MPNSTFWKKFFLVLKVIEVRLRFIAILVITALAIGYWDTIANYWDKWTRSAPTEIGKLAKDEEFYCPMHPQVVRDDFDPNGETPHCPICGMPLSLRKKGDAAHTASGRNRTRAALARTSAIGRHRNRPNRLPTARQADRHSRQRRLRSEPALADRSRVNGYVEKLYVNKTYVAVKQDQPLAEIYSPELYASSQELLLLAVRLRVAGNSELVAPARQRLNLLGVSRRGNRRHDRHRQSQPAIGYPLAAHGPGHRQEYRRPAPASKRA